MTRRVGIGGSIDLVAAADVAGLVLVFKLERPEILVAENIGGSRSKCEPAPADFNPFAAP